MTKISSFGHIYKEASFYNANEIFNLVIEFQQVWWINIQDPKLNIQNEVSIISYHWASFINASLSEGDFISSESFKQIISNFAPGHGDNFYGDSPWPVET